ncbi:class I SAM-dependent methyltransferase [Shouchella clausii]|uniref:class I SAM-dependent methyltransferase n=1 Tax=Shouchella clausii TaxID=79880 RepID=UPI0031FD2CC9
MAYSKDFLEQVETAMKQSFSGWNFEQLRGRVKEEELDWSYRNWVKESLNQRTVLDMGTGGGEFLSSCAPFQGKVYATEGYEPNVEIAQKALAPFGVCVRYIEDDDYLPFSDGTFDGIINRHESYSERELARILKPGGTFITQQVGGDDCKEINDALSLPLNTEFAEWKLEVAVDRLVAHGFSIEAKTKAFPKQRFFDIGALIYYLRAIPWQAPGFSVERHMPQLDHIAQEIKKNGYFETTQHRFILKARK